MPNPLTQQQSGLDTISTIMPSKFVDSALAIGMTPENLASLVLTNCTDDFLQKLKQGASIKSSNPENQECSDCKLNASCKRAFNRKGLICFEIMSVLIFVLAITWLALPRTRKVERLEAVAQPSAYQPELRRNADIFDSFASI